MKQMDNAKTLRVIDLFAGAGGLTLGFTRHASRAFHPIWAIDNNRSAVATYNANFGSHCIEGDITSLLESGAEVIPQADVVIGGPPCQGFSLLNKKRDGDRRKHLWQPFLDVVHLANASIFLMENVPELLRSEEFDSIQDVTSAMGFRLVTAKLCAADYGVPQMRYRAFILGCRFADPSSVFPPPPTHEQPQNGSKGIKRQGETLPFWRTVRDAIGDLPPPEGTEIRNELPPLNLHWGRSPTDKSLARYRAIPGEGMNRFDLQKKAPGLTPKCWIKKTSGGTDLFGRLWWDRPGFTIRTEFFKPEKGRYLHPQQHRPLTHREAARLQSFPDNFVFCGTKIEIARQIGNAVPPLLADAIAHSVYLLVTKHRQK